MGYRIKDVINVIEDFAPLSIQESWDNSGLCIGSPESEVSSVLLGLDCTEQLVNEAIACGADLIVTHHPLIFSGLKKISPDDPTGAAVFKAISNGISIYAAHTNADKAAGGVSALMAEKLQLKECMPLTPDSFGVVGNLEAELPVEEFAAKVKEAFGVDVVRASKPLEEKIRRVAVCGGSGRSFIPDAMANGVQAYVTGDITYHEFYAEKGFMVMDIGHYFSEYGIVEVFANILSKNFPTFAVSISKKNNNPIYYY
jgi:dinuclear metal center YbgI/SA1388 family protein